MAFNMAHSLTEDCQAQGDLFGTDFCVSLNVGVSKWCLTYKLNIQFNRSLRLSIALKRMKLCYASSSGKDLLIHVSVNTILISFLSTVNSSTNSTWVSKTLWKLTNNRFNETDDGKRKVWIPSWQDIQSNVLPLDRKVLLAKGMFRKQEEVEKNPREESGNCYSTGITLCNCIKGMMSEMGGGGEVFQSILGVILFTQNSWT